MNKFKILIITLTLFLISFSSQSQKLSIYNLESICNKKKWESVNQFFLTKKWEYYESKKGNSDKYNTITWSYNKSYKDEAEAWFYLYTYEGFPNKLSYSVFNKPSYLIIQNSLKLKGYKLNNSEIEDNKIISTYTNSKFILKITTEKRVKEESFGYENKSLTAYKFLLIKKKSIYDTDNGKKTEYYYSGRKKSEYTLQNGKLNGNYKSYFSNGNVKKTGFYIKGLGNGKFTEHNEKGIKTYEYNLRKDKLNGVFKIYFANGKLKKIRNYQNGKLNGIYKTYFENGNLKKIGSYLNELTNGMFTEYNKDGWKAFEYNMVNGKIDGTLKEYNKSSNIIKTTSYNKGLKNGEDIIFHYDDKTNKLLLKSTTNYLNDKRNGVSKIIFFDKENNEERVLKKINYIDGLKDGNTQDIKGDSLIIANYNHGELNGSYKIYLDLSRVLFGGVIKTDTTALNLKTSGYYTNNKKSKYWKNYQALNNQLISEGGYIEDKKNGEWKYYHSNLFKKKTSSNSTKPYLIENYKNGKFHGEYELRDSTQSLISKGYYQYGQKHGTWTIKSNNKGYKNGRYFHGKEDGTWTYYNQNKQKTKTINYSSGILDGNHHEWDTNTKKLKFTKDFKNDKLISEIIYSHDSNHPKVKYENFDFFNNSFRCKYTEYIDGELYSQVYRIKEKYIDHVSFNKSFQKLLKRKFNDEIFKNGKFEFINKQGVVEVKGSYYKNEKTGDWEYYYTNQNIYIIEQYINNRIILEKYLTKERLPYSGKVKIGNEIRNVKKGLRNGTTKLLDINGKTIMKTKYKNGKIK